MAGRTVGDPAKAAEAKGFYDRATKEITTTMFKWKADWMAAEPLFQQAARAYKAAGLVDAAVDSWKQAVQCSIKMGNLKQAVVTLEAAARELQIIAGTGATGAPARKKASDMLAEAGDCLVEAGDFPRAADLKLRAGKLLEASNPDAAAALYDSAASLFDDDDDKDVYAKEALSKVLTHQLGLGKHASAMRTMDKLAKVFVRLNQPHNTNKLILSRVVLLLASADPVAAQREYSRYLDVPGFPESTEAAAAEDLVNTYQEMNSSALQSVVDRNVFNYLDHAVTRIAKGLPKAVATGTTVGVAHAGESATHAVAHITAAATAAAAAAGGASAGGDGGDFGGFRVVSTGGSGLAEEAHKYAAPLGKAAAAAAAEKEASDRAALFGGSGTSSAGAARSSLSASAGGGGGGATGGAGTGDADDHGASADAGGGHHDDYDYEAAFHKFGLDAGGGGDGSDAGAHDAVGAAAGAAAAAAAAGGDEAAATAPAAAAPAAAAPAPAAPAAAPATTGGGDDFGIF